jgi:hypothetical protein
MRDKSLGWALLWGLLLAWSPPAAQLAAGVEEAEVWANEAFVKRASAIRDGSWEKVSTRDVAIVQLFEIGRKAEGLERRLSSQIARFYTLAYRGGLALGTFLILHLVLTIAMLARLGRQRGPG